VSKEEENEEVLTDWEKATSKKLEKLDTIEKDITEIKKLVASKPAPVKMKPPKRAKTTVKELIAKSTPFLGDFNPQRFIELAQKEGLVGDKNYSDQDIALLSHAIGEPLLILDEDEREDAIKFLSEKLEIDPKRFEAVAEEEIIFPVDSEWYGFEEEEAPAEIIEETPEEETPEEE